MILILHQETTNLENGMTLVTVGPRYVDLSKLTGVQKGSIALKDSTTRVLMLMHIFLLYLPPRTILLLQIEVVVASLLNE